MIDDRRLSELMLVHKLLTPRQLQEARRRQEQDGGDLYRVLIQDEMVPEERALTVVAEYLNLPCVSLRDFEANAQVLTALPAELAARYQALPLGREQSQDGPRLYLAMSNPLDVAALQEISDYTHCRVVAYLAGPLDLERALERAYGSALYRVRSTLDALFGGDAPPTTVGSYDRGPSVSQLLEMPILPREDAEDEAMRMESLQHLHHEDASSLTRGSALPSFSPSAPRDAQGRFVEQPPTSPLSGNSISSLSEDPYLESDELDDLLEDSAASLLGEEFSLAEEVGSELFGVSASKIFVRPEALTDIGRKRLEETARQKRLAEQNNHTRLGVFHTTDQGSGDPDQDPLAEHMPSLHRASRHLDLDASSVPAFRVPHDLADRSLRVLQPEAASPLEQLLGQTPDGLLLRALTRLLVESSVVSLEELRASIALMRDQD